MNNQVLAADALYAIYTSLMLIEVSIGVHDGFLLSLDRKVFLVGAKDGAAFLDFGY